MTFLAVSASLVLSCGLTATPDGQMPPDGTLAMINAPIPNDLATSLASGSPPPAQLRFPDSRDPISEWIIGIRSDPEKGNLVARLSRGIFAYKVRFGWAANAPGTDGITAFEETSTGTCEVKDAVAQPPKASK